MLGWRILKEGEYKIRLPTLSNAEQELILLIEQKVRQATVLEQVIDERQREAFIKDLLIKAAQEKNAYLDNDQLNYLSKISITHIFGHVFLDELLEDDEVEEISIIGPQKPAYVYIRQQGWKKTNACFEDQKTIADVINKMARVIGRHITAQNPRIDAMLQNGSRLHASLEPISKGEITIRKFRRNPFSPKELAENHTIDSKVLALLSVIMQSDSNLIIGGNTASGKTTTLNAIFSFIPANERILIVEETPEINIPHLHQLRIVANKDLEVSLKDLVYDSLRMRPDRLIVGEIRNKEEAEALRDVLLAGQARGSYATFHAQSSQEVFLRLKSFEISEEDLKSIDCIVIQRRMLIYDAQNRKNQEIRKVVEITEGGRNRNALYSNSEIAKESELLGRCADAFKMSAAELLAEIEKREKMITTMPKEFSEFYKLIQQELYGLEVM